MLGYVQNKINYSIVKVDGVALNASDIESICLVMKRTWVIKRIINSTKKTGQHA